MRTWIINLKNIAFLFVLVFALDVSADVEEHVSGCVRLYCSKHVKEKIKDENGHGLFFPAKYDKNKHIYSITSSTAELILEICDASGKEWDYSNFGIDPDDPEITSGSEAVPKIKGIPGTDATKFERTAPWLSVQVEPDGKYKEFINPDCKQEKK